MKQNQLSFFRSRFRATAGAAVLIVLIAATAACTRGGTGSGYLPEGNYPIKFTASVEAMPETRATADDTWAGGEEVTVQLGSDVKNYTVAPDGSMTPSGGVPFYWEGMTDISVTAWCPASWSAARPVSFSVQADQSGDGFQQSDFLYTTARAASGNSCALAFRHLPAKVVVQLVDGVGVTAADVAAAGVSIVGQSLTSGTVDAGGTVRQASSGNAVITPMELAPAQGFPKSVQALVTPCRMEGRRFIRVCAGSYDYYYTPAGAEGNLSSGKQYTYTITVQATGLSVTLETVTEWTGTDEQVDSKTLLPGFASYELKAGDYYYSDGQTSDGGYRRYTDGTTTDRRIPPVLQDASGNPRTVVGIVFWAGDPTNTVSGDPALRREHPHCTHGLVVALKDASASTFWQTAWSDIGNWMNTTTTGYENIATGTGDTDNLQKIMGYNNTQAISMYNDYCDSQGGMDDNKVLPVIAIAGYAANNPAPAGSSGWYFPSPKELSTLCSGWFDGNIWDIENVLSLEERLVNRDLVNSRLTALGNGVAGEISPQYYWSCSEDADGPDDAFGLDFNGGWVLNNLKDNYLVRVRPVLAF